MVFSDYVHVHVHGYTIKSILSTRRQTQHAFHGATQLFSIRNDGNSNNRRTFLSTLGWSAWSLPALAQDSVPSDFFAEESLPNGLLETRVSENVLSPPPYGMEGPDVFYPTWLSGNWNVESILVNVSAPCGIALFGGNATMAAAIKEIRQPLNYEARFISNGQGSIISDREYNVKAIAKVTLGPNSVVDVSLATPNQFSCLLSPEGSPTMLNADLIVLHRRQETVDQSHFDCAEVVREIVVSAAAGSRSQQKRSLLLKEIETCSLYTAVVPKDGGPITQVNCQQRSASFLLPSQQDPMAMKMFEYSRGRPVDVRYYDVMYTKR